MGHRGRMSRSHSTRLWVRLSAFRMVILAPTFLGLVIGSPGCMTRADHPVVGADSTLVYVSRLPADVNASITFQVKDSAVRDQAKRRDRERGREISRLQKERDRLLKLENRQEKQRQLDEKRKAAAEKKAKKTKKGKKGKNRTQAGVESPKISAGSDGGNNAAGDVAVGIVSDARPSSPGTTPPLSLFAVRDSLTVVESRLRALAAEDSLAEIAPWKQKRPDGSPVDERAVDTEEGARVQANIRLENVYARGKRPLTLHFVWLGPEKKKIFKRMLEYTPNDSVQVLTSSLTISPSKRAPGFYTLQIFLFRERIAEKLLELRGTGHEEREEGGNETM